MSLTTKSLSLICAFAGVLSAQASDFTTDKVHNGPMGSPFDRANRLALPADVSLALGQSLKGCLVQRFKHTAEINIVDRVASICPNVVTSYVSENWTTTLTIRLSHKQTITVMGFDGNDSDHGDEEDLAFYDDQGQRIGVMTGMYGNCDPLEDLASALKIEIKQIDTPDLKI